MRWTRHAGVGFFCVWAFACDSKPAPHPVWGSEDLSPIVQMFQGKSTVRVHAVELFGRDGGGPIRESVDLEVEGDRVVATSKAGERLEGKIRAASPCQVAIEVPGGKRKRPYTFARNGKDMWLGTTDAGAKLSDGSWLICSYYGYLTLKEGKCTFHALTGLSWEPKEFMVQPVECSVKGDRIEYETFMGTAPDKRSKSTIEIRGDALLSGPLASDRVER